jgi:hypothetical protein
MTNKILHCYHCNSTFSYIYAHAGFGDEVFFYCDKCGMVATIDMYCKEYRPFYEKHIAVRTYDAQNKKDLEIFEENFSKMKQGILKNLKPCSCGGTFTIDAIPRCPVCSKELEWNQMVDEIDKTSGSTIPHYFKNFVKKGWKDIYYFVFNNRQIRNNWKDNFSGA